MELPDNVFEFHLPANIKLTAGQSYYWGVIAQAGLWTGRASGSFRTDPVEADGTPFSGVTIITHGFQLNPLPGNSPFQQPQQFLDMAGRYADPTGGLVLKYNRADGRFVEDLIDSDGKNYNGGDGVSAVEDGKPVVLVLDWYKESDISDAGFAEAAADAMYASLVDLDNKSGGMIFGSPLHFIGHSRGTVVNSEIIQRLGVWNEDVKDIHMTTLDPHDFKQPSLDTAFDFADFRNPNVQRWTNVGFFDNYSQTVPIPPASRRLPMGGGSPARMWTSTSTDDPGSPPTTWPAVPTAGSGSGTPVRST